MNTNQMEALYDKLCAYAPKAKIKKDGIKTTSSFRDRYCGTCVEYSIGEYTIECRFSYESSPGYWMISVTPLLENDVRFPLSEPVRFGADCPELFEEIDLIAQGLETMQSVIGSVRKAYKDCLKPLK